MKNKLLNGWAAARIIRPAAGLHNLQEMEKCDI